MPGLSLVDSGCPSKLPGSRLAQNPQLNFSLPSTRVQGLTSLQAWHPSSWLMQPLRLVFSFDHLTSSLFGPSTSLNAPSLADPRCRRFSAPDHTQTLLPLPLLPFQNPPALLPLLPFQNPPALLPLLPFQNPPARLPLLPFQNPPARLPLLP